MHDTHWRNWAGTQDARPRRTLRPATVGELQTAVAGAAADGLAVKAVGSGHSFTGAAATGGALVRTDSLQEPVHVDPAAGRVTVQGGMPLHRLNRVLADHGMALENLGDIDRQTVAGAISTGTHGTGATLGGLATQVTALDLVTADGSLVHCSADERPDLFAAARVGLGALGVIARVTLRCVPAFHLYAREEPMAMSRVVPRMAELAAEHDHFEFYWFPHTDRALVKRNDRISDPAEAPAGPPGAWESWWERELLSNTVFEAANRAAARVPAVIPMLNGVSARALSPRRYCAPSHEVFCSPRRVVFAESEYAVPAEAAAEVLGELRRHVEREQVATAFPVEVRFAAADDVWLSTAFGRPTVYIAVHQYHRMDYTRYFRAFTEIAQAAEGRPHWGKLHWLDAEDLAGLYPRFPDFLRVRAEVDPGGVFANPYLDRVLGPVASQK